MDDNGNHGDTAKNGSPFMSTAQAARYVRLKPATLDKMRVAGRGPKFRKHGRYVVYHIDDLNEWSTAHVQVSTSDHRADARA